MADYISNAHVKCDKCDWQLAINHTEIPQWHNKQCPKCNDCIIVNDDDLAAYEYMVAISNIQNILCPDETDFIKVTIDTAELLPR
ncbi:MAG: hypothetical protein PHS33_07590 [Candidatus Omnitrophica bacterium]|nr:hypothetical protein [Candidatus Omnitrophota bacterium]